MAVFGAPQGLIGTLTHGLVSAVGRSGFTGILAAGGATLGSMPSVGLEFSQLEMIQTDAAINGGNSGGPAVNMQAEVIGVSDLGWIGFESKQSEQLNFLIPSNTVKRVVPSLITDGRYQHPWLGVSGTDLTSGIADALGLEDPQGFLVVQADSDSPAVRAGIISGSKLTDIPREGRSGTFGWRHSNRS